MKFILIILIFILSCKRDSNPTDARDNLLLLGARANKSTVTGTAIKGIIKNAIVSVYPIKSDGSCDTSKLLASAFTDSSGNYSISYTKNGSTTCLRVTGNPNGTSRIFDEKLSQDLVFLSSSPFNLTTYVQESKVPTFGRGVGYLSPFSRIVTKRVNFLAKQTSGSDISQLVRRANKEVVIRFGLNQGLTLTNSRDVNDKDYPELDDLTIELSKPNSPLTSKFISVLVGFSQLANKNKKGTSLSIEDLESIIEAFAVDFEDGKFDGMSGSGSTITIGNTNTPLGNNSLTSTLLPAIIAYFQEGGKLNIGNGASVPDISLTTLVSEIRFNDTETIITSIGSSNTPPSSISYSGSPFIFTVGTSIGSRTVSFSGGTPTLFSVSPSLPSGLTISASTGTISGTPTATSSATNYTITGSNSSGSASTTINITINPITKKIFRTAVEYPLGTLGGVSGADSRCNTDANYPGSGIYKAFLVTNSGTRRACSTANCSGGISENVDWVLYPNANYIRLDSVAFGSTNSAAIFNFSLTNQLVATLNNYHMTGMNANWTSNANDCSAFTSTAGSISGGNATLTTNGFLTNSVPACNYGPGYYLVCAEQ
ncbi:MAG: DUF1554 domain-containing protein [Leptospiraceae bacterium]|nr:DUF1554 domain-containing protein [Leptospiraceae bacterium]